MPTVPPQIELEEPAKEQELGSAREADGREPRAGGGDADAPISVVPHEKGSRAVAAPARIRTNRYGELEEHELIRLLDTIEDERARGRFRESIYISMFVWLAIAWVVFYGPRYLWHAPQLISPVEMMKRREMVQLNAPVLRHPVLTPPKVDSRTLEHLRATEPKVKVGAPEAPHALVPAPALAMAQPLPSNPAPSLPLPSAPAPVVAHATPPVADAPVPQPTKPNFSTATNASDDMRDAVRDAARNRNNGTSESSAGIRIPGGGSGGGGMQILSDTQGVDFSQWSKHFNSDVMRNWAPLLPEETEAPLYKKGQTFLIVKIMKDGSLGDIRLENSSHDVAIDRAAWNSITSEGKFEILPKAFTGPFIVLRLHYVVNEDLR